jgi:ribosomal protein S18 acetylase RimI-like enzyme
MTITFDTIDSNNKRFITKFRKDAHIISFGNDNDYDEEAYIDFALRGAQRFPDGFVFVLHNDKIIGQIEMQIKDNNGEKMGFINLFYLIPEQRGKGVSNNLISYAMSFFKKGGCNYCILRVAEGNYRAIRFYEKYGFYKISKENELIVYRSDIK